MNLIYLPADNSPLDFVAYYPYTAGLENNIYTVDVSDQSDQSAIDLMAADWESADPSAPRSTSCTNSRR